MANTTNDLRALSASDLLGRLGCGFIVSIIDYFATSGAMVNSTLPLAPSGDITVSPRRSKMNFSDPGSPAILMISARCHTFKSPLKFVVPALMAGGIFGSMAANTSSSRSLYDLGRVRASSLDTLSLAPAFSRSSRLTLRFINRKNPATTIPANQATTAKMEGRCHAPAAV